MLLAKERERVDMWS